MTTYTLLRRAQRAFEKSDLSQRDVARALDVNPSSVSRALRNGGLQYTAMQARILSYLTGVPVERQSVYEGAHVRHRWIMAPEVG